MLPLHAAHAESRQWRVTELTFEAEQSHAEPMKVACQAVFRGPDGALLEMPAFWDGGDKWKVRFTPVLPGRWSYATTCEGKEDAGLDKQQGEIEALPAEGTNPLHRHGGFLRVSENQRYLTYADGTPFFWLGDTWWFCPSRLCPLEGASDPRYSPMFRTLIDVRRREGYTVVELGFHGSGNETLARDPQQWSEPAIRYWREVDRYIAVANQAGLMPAIGFPRDIYKRNSQEALKRLWRYVIARYGAHAVGWLVANEYNKGNTPALTANVMAMGQYIKEYDPYHRALSIHPAIYREDGRQAWGQPWYDFIMLQGGHGGPPPVSFYAEGYGYRYTKPMLESECNYEGIHHINAEGVRLAAYRAIQSGSFGYTYGAQGLWYPTQNEQDAKFKEWGDPVPWWKALDLPGGRQMQYLRSAYESAEWWKLEPRPDAVSLPYPMGEKYRVLVKAEGSRIFAVYFPGGTDQRARAVLAGAAPGASYSVAWFNPRTGEKRSSTEILSAQRAALILPARPDRGDWLLVLRRKEPSQ